MPVHISGDVYSGPSCERSRKQSVNGDHSYSESDFLYAELRAVKEKTDKLEYQNNFMASIVIKDTSRINELESKIKELESQSNNYGFRLSMNEIFTKTLANK